MTDQTITPPQAQISIFTECGAKVLPGFVGGELQNALYLFPLGIRATIVKPAISAENSRATQHRERRQE